MRVGVTWEVKCGLCGYMYCLDKKKTCVYVDSSRNNCSVLNASNPSRGGIA